MILLSILLIPIIIEIIVFVLCKEINIKEFLILFLISLLIAGVSTAIIYYNNIYYTEIHNGYVIKKDVQKVHCRHSYDCHCYTSCSGSGRNTSCSTHCQTCYEHSYDMDWNIYTNLKTIYTINTIDRQGLIMPKRWDIVKLYDPIAKQNKYKNYIKASPDSLFNYHGLVEKYKDSLPGYPNKIYDIYKIDRIISQVTIENIQEYNIKLSYINGRLGSSKQCNIILVIVQNKIYEWFKALQQYWLGGNKNDIIIVINLDINKEISWVNISALVKDDIFKVKLRDELQEFKKFELADILYIIERNVQDNYQRKSMKDFSYLMAEITPSILQLIIAIIANLIVSIAVTIYFYKEDPFN